MSCYENPDFSLKSTGLAETEISPEQRAAKSRLLADAAFLAGGAELVPIYNKEGNIDYSQGRDGYRVSPTLEQVEQCRIDMTAADYSRDAEAPYADQTIITMDSLLPEVYMPAGKISIRELNTTCQYSAVADRRQYNARLGKPGVRDEDGMVRNTRSLSARQSGYGFGMGGSHLTYITEGGTNRLLSVTYEAPNETYVKDSGITLCYDEDYGDSPRSIRTVLHYTPHDIDGRVLSPLVKLVGKRNHGEPSVVDALQRELYTDQPFTNHDTFEITFGKEPKLEFYHSDSLSYGWQRNSGMLFRYEPERECFVREKNGTEITIGIDVAFAMVYELLGVLSTPPADPKGYR